MGTSRSSRSGSSTPPDSFTPATPATLDDGFWLDLTYGEAHWALCVTSKDAERLRTQFEAFKAWRFSNSNRNTGEDNDARTSDRIRVTDSLTLATAFLRYTLDQMQTVNTIGTVLSGIQTSFLRDSDVHSLASNLDLHAQKVFLRSYYQALDITGDRDIKTVSALFRPGKARASINVYAICGGQGPSNASSFQDLQDLNAIYAPLLRDLIQTASQMLTRLSAQSPFFRAGGAGRFDLVRWLEQPETAPPKPIIATAPYSFPLIGLITLCNYCITCKVLGQEPGEVRSMLQGVTGHSQGVIAAAAIAASDSWESFYHHVRFAMEALFWIGVEAHREMKFRQLPLAAIQDCVEGDEGAPSPMLSIRGLDQVSLKKILQDTNKSLGQKNEVFLALINSRDNMVVGGPPRSLYGLNMRLRNLKARDGDTQSRVLFNQRSATIHHAFLPISAAFHSPYANPIVPRVRRALKAYCISGSDLGVDLYHTYTGTNLKDLGEADVIETLIRMVTSELVDWPQATSFPDASYVLDFGPGRIGSLVQKNSEGTGVRVISAADLAPYSGGIGAKSEIFSAFLPDTPPNWGLAYAPKLVTDSFGTKSIETRMTRLLGVPPVMVAGMTPTTVPWDFVTSVTQGGYHVELAGGGYINSQAFEEAIKKVAANIPSSFGITCNIIYASPKAVSWQIPLIQRMIREGYPIEGLCIGAGVPSPEIADEYIQTLGLKHISFKPGSQEAILQVIKIANDHPSTPIGLQWTGGRGGGHHSYEDFHAPILATYGKIRSCDNIVLIAGSGFGGAEDTFEYLTGQWSQSLGYPMMPFDGTLLGSRMMVTKEAHTSSQAKDLIVQAEGVGDSEWHGTYERATGGVITVTSEMGQPIHKLATRGVLLWKDFDRRFFSITDRSKRLSELLKHKEEIVERLNRDFQKPWFGVNPAGLPVDVEDMTYLQVLQRLISLMFVSQQHRWIDPSYQSLVEKFALRAQERLLGKTLNAECNLTTPSESLDRLVTRCPRLALEIMHPEDASYFIGLCRRGGQKPVNFIPRLDENFETWFKKDSLWQAEDVDAIFDQDVQRVCIIQGPVAARYSHRKDEPVKSVLDEIMGSYIAMITEANQDSNVGTIEGEANTMDQSFESHSKMTASNYPRQDILTMDNEDLDLPDYLEGLVVQLPGWFQACIHDQSTTLDGRRYPNPIRAALCHCQGYKLQIDYDGEYSVSKVSVVKTSDNGPIQVLAIAARSDSQIDVRVAETGSPTKELAVLEFVFEYHPERKSTRLVDITENRNSRIKRFYSKLWLGDYDESIQFAGVSQTFQGEKTTICHRNVQDFLMAADQADTNQAYQSAPDDIVPIGFCIVLAWSALVKPLLTSNIDGDLMRLLHRSNQFEYVKGARPLRVGDTVESSSRVQSVTITSGGKLIEVRAELRRGDSVVMVVTSAFFIQGDFHDHENTFRCTREPCYELLVVGPMESALLKSRKWLHFEQDDSSLLGQRLIFETTTREKYTSTPEFLKLDVTGGVYVECEGKLVRKGTVHHTADRCSGNPVTAFLKRHGTLTETVQLLQNAGWSDETSWTVQVPPDNTGYAAVSKDTNPIHMSPVFAGFARLPGVVTHGMLTSATVQRLVENAVAEADAGRCRRWRTSFEGMVFPDDELNVEVQHVAMTGGRMLFMVQAFRSADGVKVLEAEAEVEQPRTAYVFTGQGSQEKGMGMVLYEESAAARMVWDRADRHLLKLYGFSILDIVRNDPKHLRLHFGGLQGRKIRQNYMDMTIQRSQSDGTVIEQPIVKDLTAQSSSYTFSDPRGLLYSTQFAQPALTIMELAEFEHAKSQGLIQDGATFAGHSLGEYSALGAIGEIMSLEALASLVFYRGLTMQLAMQRDSDGRTEYSMVAANPSRVAKSFDQAAFEKVVQTIARESQVLLEIVNFNVQGRQYVCAGHLRALWIMGQTLDKLAHAEPSTFRDEEALTDIVRQCNAAAQNVGQPIKLVRGTATIPLAGIDVPFHSSYIRGGIEPYRKYLQDNILEANVDPARLVDRFIPNVMAKPFALHRDYIQEAAETMDSSILRDILAQDDVWPKCEAPMGAYSLMDHTTKVI